MRRLLSSLLVVGLLGTAAPAVAQVDVVAHVKADLQLRGVNLSGTCGAFEITKRVAWTLRAAGWGIIAKPGGDNCSGYGGDKLVSSTGRFVDILIDQGGANTPAWQERAASADELAARVDPMDPGDAPAPGPVPPPVGPPPSVDFAAVLAQLSALAAKVDSLEQEDRGDQAQVLAQLDALGKKVDNPAWYAKAAKFLATNPIAVAIEGAVAACVPTKCWQSVGK